MYQIMSSNALSRIVDFARTLWIWTLRCIRRISQMRPLLAACRELAVDFNTLSKMLHAFFSINRDMLWPMLQKRIVLFWHISRVKFVVIPPRFVKQKYLRNIGIQLPVGSYNSWANMWCSGCLPLGEKIFVKQGYYYWIFHTVQYGSN